MEDSSHISLFSRLAIITYILLLGIAAGNFAINIVKNSDYMRNLDVVTNLEILLQKVPDCAHATRELILIVNNEVQPADDPINDYSTQYPTKYSFY